MKTRILATALLMMICLTHATAQSHKVGQANYNCKLNKKGWFFNSEKHPCPACQVKEDKEEKAKRAEDKRREDVAAAKAKAAKAAADAAYKKQQEEIAARSKVTEVKVVLPKEPIAKKNNTGDGKNYKIVNAYKFGNSQYQNYNSKVMLNDKLVFESNDFLYITKIDNEILFIGQGVRFDDCKLSYSTNNNILLDANFKKVNLPGIDKFYYGNTDRENKNYFSVSVLTGQCSKRENDRYNEYQWGAVDYIFEYNTWRLIKSEPSAWPADCACN